VAVKDYFSACKTQEYVTMLDTLSKACNILVLSNYSTVATLGRGENARCRDKGLI